jgi:transposase
MKLGLPEDFRKTGVSDEDWDRTPDSVKKLLLHLLVRIEELEERLNANSTNSSKPPSTDPPWLHPTRRKGKSKRKRGGQPGHEGVTREPVPPEEVDEVVECSPMDGCEYCGNRDIEIDRDLYTPHYRWELPEIKPNVTEFRCLTYWCADCERWHTTSLPLVAGQGMLGPRAMAMVSLLAGKYHMSTRGIEEYLEDAYNLKVSLGTVSKTEERVTEVLEQPHDEVRAHIKEQPVVGVDETGWKVAGCKAWMWVATTPLVAVFLVSLSRGAEVAKELLGESFKGIVVSDRWNAYNWIATIRRQLCWSHLIRDFEKIAGRSGQSGAIGECLLRCSRRLFSLIHKVRDGTLDMSAFTRKVKRLRGKIDGLLFFGMRCGHSKTQETCKNIRSLSAAMWTFLKHAGVEPTNNASERAIRPAVLWRKNCFGTQSERGSLFVARMMTVCATCRLQGRNVLDFLTESIEAHNTGRPKPSLLPRTDARPLAMAA